MDDVSPSPFTSVADEEEDEEEEDKRRRRQSGSNYYENNSRDDDCTTTKTSSCCRRKTTDDDDGFHRDAFEWFCNCAESSESAEQRDYRGGRSFNERNIGDDKRFGDLTERVPYDERRTKSN